ncbi:MAG: HD domain-containing protein [Planctomycetes bacterium]|nr:HD domain-containing protein [Planctomycetota bacterium]
MLRVGVEDVRPGMTLAVAVCHPKRPGTTLLSAGVTLERRSIRRLRELPIGAMWIEHPAFADLDEQIRPEVLRAQREVAETVIDAFDGALAGRDSRLDYVRYRASIVEMIRRMLRAPRSIMFVEEMIRNGHPALAHGANVCIMSVMMGLKLAEYLVQQRSRLDEWYARDVTNLGLGAMFHDIGQMRLDPTVLERWRRDRNTYDPAWREHARIGWSLVRETIGAAGAAAVLNHHQHFDGSGFPPKTDRRGSARAVVGEDIHVFARIVGVADLFDALRFPEHEAPPEMADTDEKQPAERPAIPTVRALKLMGESPWRERLDPVAYRALISVTPAYAPGTIVGLSNGRNAVVIDWTPHDPCRPTVREFDMDGIANLQWDGGRTYALASVAGLSIVSAEGFDVSDDAFHPEPAGHSWERFGRGPLPGPDEAGRLAG